MKHNIASNMWERKKGLIVQLYQDEEWPLKQVLKRIRTHTFNPSETQLRSRLKKWRITKLSRRRHKRSLFNQHEDSGIESSSKEPSSEDQTPVYSGDEAAQPTTSATTNESLPEEDWYSAERGDTTHSPPTARVLVPHTISNSFTATMSAMSPPCECHDVPSGYCPSLHYSTTDYCVPPVERPGPEIASAQWPAAFWYRMSLDDAAHYSLSQFYTPSSSSHFIHQPAHVMPLPHSDWFQPPGHPLVTPPQ
ncbi:hypothetical protein ETB97_003280 [Aspergillus alliaceus]|uniref:Uncharacterized protein n=1 Tax=Petromyces alliaceus TaxID=209559 RepID=A0A5N6FZH9_PETAA|nr:uncharacterized protein BDW43DRAFT_310629 [Aspergillus alliaceus]KAB8233953.1 hypothetical protein BDW43DRAFT_310629 [Aspergillus alliaceus]KAF5859139.1 hypothetical protein ETB97_003280 [Aspergillus burnettii]